MDIYSITARTMVGSKSAVVIAKDIFEAVELFNEISDGECDCDAEDVDFIGTTSEKKSRVVIFRGYDYD